MSNKDGINTIVGILFSSTVVPVTTHVELKCDVFQLSLHLLGNRRHFFKVGTQKIFVKLKLFEWC